MAILRSRLYALEEERRRAAEKSLRSSQVGSGGRSEKIRTYNVPQDRITDHRIKQTWHNIHEILDGGLAPVLAALRTAELAGTFGTGSSDDDEE